MEKKLKGLIYFIVKQTAKICLRIFYRGIEINGRDNLPTDQSPVIYAVNHQNAFMDAIIVGGLSPIPTYFMTRSDVFKPPFDWILDALKMMPIYRIRDGYSSLSKNEQVFKKCNGLLEEGNAIMIFPEGNHGLEYYLRPLTKGIARMAMSTQMAIENSVHIIPLGLNYFDHFNSGHKLILNYGKPILASGFLESYKAQKHQALLSLTKAISEGMKTTLIIAEHSTQYDEQKLLYNNLNEKYRFVELKEKIRENNFNKEVKTSSSSHWVTNMLAIPNLPPFLLSNWIIKNKVSQKIFTSSIKIAIGILVFPVWLLSCFTILSFISLNLAIIVLSIQLLSLLIRKELRFRLS